MIDGLQKIHYAIYSRAHAHFSNASLDIMEILAQRFFALIAAFPSSISISNLCSSYAQYWLQKEITYILWGEFFKRPLIEAEIQKVIEESLGKPKRALIIHTNTDPNGAFSYFYDLIDIYKDCAKQHQIDRWVGFNDFHVFGPVAAGYDVLLLLGHGSQKVIRLDASTDDFTAEVREKVLLFKKLLKNRSKLILHSCKTGAGEDSLAQNLSKKIPNADIFAPNNNLGLDYFHDEEMNPRFQRKGENITVHLKRGKPISNLEETTFIKSFEILENSSRSN